MNKKIFLIAISMLLACAAGFSMATNKEDVVVGTIAYLGNEPFVQLVVKAEDGKVYTLKGDDEVISAIKKEFGKRIQFYGMLTASKKGKALSPTYDGVFEVAFFDVLD